MKKLVADPSLCQGCRACEMACSKAFYKEEDSSKSAIRIHENEDGTFRIDVCDQCGVCAEMCSSMALPKDKKGVLRVDRKSCVGCLICVAECVRGYMYYHDDLPTPFKCIACGICVKACPHGALSIVED